MQTSMADSTVTYERPKQNLSIVEDIFGKIKVEFKRVLITLSNRLTGEDRGTSSNNFESATHIQELSNEEEREIQRRLTHLGYNPGPVDGIIGKETRLSIYAYQANYGLRIDGIASPALLAHIRKTENRPMLVSQAEPVEVQ